jgi:hypothetical protein
MFVVAVACAVGFVALVSAAALLGGAIAMGVAIAVFNMVFGVASMCASVRPSGGTWRDVLRIYAPSLAAGCLAIGGAFAASRLVPGGTTAGWVFKALIIFCVGSAAYPLLARLLAPQDWRDLISRAAALLSRRAGTARP